MEEMNDGRQCRTVDTEQFIAHVEELSGLDLEWFFDVYLRQPQLPTLESRRDGDRLVLRWQFEGAENFPMPVDVMLGDEVRRLEMPGGKTVVAIPPGVEPIIDPESWVLRVAD